MAVNAAAEHGLEAVDQAAVTERSAGALAGAQALVRGLGVVLGKEPVGATVAPRGRPSSIRSDDRRQLGHVSP